MTHASHPAKQRQRSEDHVRSGLPGPSGTDVCRYIREQPWGTSVRIVAVSGLGQKQDHRRTLAAGFNQHLTKPVNPDQLLALLSASEQADQAKA